MRLSAAVMLLLWCAPAIRAQFPEVATNDDGSDLYFTTSLTPRRPEIVRYPETRIFLIHNAAPPEMFAEIDSPFTAALWRGYGLQNLHLSGDSSVVAFTEDRGLTRVLHYGPGRKELGSGILRAISR
ncbi:MAG: hypothetical protein JNL62_07000, partial [Bryobacterales bacterium]|nr:hypothetical protein [Bryobacterales bacterium]